ncbi:MAG: hypothetical protein LKF42_09015 [Streptococcaceae bacterium]|jgi:hypothetical protein|nr:hypothetical protein [Streptococcaceae bacterium]MCH4175911.1 hypothetical protein [Streptococcaceae bacterium]
MSELTEKINAEIDKFGDMGEYGVCAGLKVARDVIEEHELQHKIELNKNQQVVLDYLKKMNRPKLKVSAMVTVFCLVDDNINDNWQEYDEIIPPHVEALQKLNIAEENQVLQVFSAWVIEQEGE